MDNHYDPSNILENGSFWINPYLMLFKISHGLLFVAPLLPLQNFQAGVDGCWQIDVMARIQGSILCHKHKYRGTLVWYDTNIKYDGSFDDNTYLDRILPHI